MEYVIQIDEDGRIALPEAIRKKYHMDPKKEIVLVEQGNGVMVRVKEAKYSFKEIFGKPLPYDPKKVITLDIANMNEDE